MLIVFCEQLPYTVAFLCIIASITNAECAKIDGQRANEKCALAKSNKIA
jgi:hypothetical protein